MARNLSRLTFAVSAGVAIWLILASDAVIAESGLTVSQRLAIIDDYVAHHVSCGPAGCGDETLDERPEDIDEPWDEGDSGDRVCPTPWYVCADYLLAWIQRNRVPPLVAAGQTATQIDPVASAGRWAGDEVRHGVRLNVGRWLDDQQDWAVEAHYLYLGDSPGGYAVDSSSMPYLNRPLIDASTGLPSAEVIASPGLYQGRIAIDTTSDIHSAGALLRKTWFSDDCARVALLGGYRYFQFYERLTIDDLRTDSGGVTRQVHDNFAVDNDFHGVDLGLNTELVRGRWSLNVLTKLAFGGVRQRLEADGRTQIGQAVSDEGLLVQSSNRGRYRDTQFAFLPELDASIGYCLTSSFSVRAGYTLMCLTDAMRTGDQVDLAMGASGGAMYPQASRDTTSLYAQGISLGGEWRR